MWYCTKARRKLITRCVLLCMASCLISCAFFIPVKEYPTPPATLQELITVVSEGGGAARVTAARALGDMGLRAELAVPALIKNLHYEHTEVRTAVADALGKIGPGAKPAVPALIGVLQNDESIQVRRSVVEALKQIGDASAVPALASVLYEEDILGPTPTPISCEPIDLNGAKVCTYGEEANKWSRTDKRLALDAAVAIAQITGENFPDAESSTYQVDEAGVPLIVIAAKEWWEKEGQFKQWPPVVTPTPEPTPTSDVTS
jgi:HEAT repeats/PBS lyase HEAT-like repeat